MLIIETDRLMLREFTIQDLPATREIVCDEQTMYAFDGAWNDEKNRQGIEKQIKSYHENGFGRWAVVLKETSQVIGICGPMWLDANNDRVLEIGYLFNRKFWHKGYATEAAIACKRYVFDTLSFNEVFSIIRDNNYAAMNVAIKNGMFVRGRYKDEGDTYYSYIFSVENN
ncbi:MAG: GNAT family N-acetyltransferase [Defluviitaleaceae bacterium]|nr:GNAT family N-acetyltransferase [Defluviitaleaceae bacterium]